MNKKLIAYDQRAHRKDPGVAFDFSQPQVYEIVKISTSGEVLIENRLNASGPVPARLALGNHDQSGPQSLKVGGNVLVVHENGNPGRPIIVGVVADRLNPGPSAEKPLLLEREELFFKGKSIVFEANGEVVIKCGGSAIIMKNDGKIVVRGKDILSRAKHDNKIKGGAVKIN